MKVFFHLYSILLIGSISPLYGENRALYASFFNATYNCNNPLILNGTVTIYLDENIIIDQCVPFVAGPLLTSADQLIFTSQDNHSVIVQSNTVVDFGTFLPQQQTIMFTGNARLIVEKGAYLIFDQNTLLAEQNAHIFFVKSVE